MLLRGSEVKTEEGRLTDETRRELARRVLERLDVEENYDGKKHKIRTVIQRQARRVASFLRGEGKYKPFVASW
jgi:CRISPR-associated protein Cas1